MQPKHPLTESGRHAEEILHFLDGIFRLIAKPVDADSLQDLAPGEIGIDYDQWTIYAKSPYSGEIITPNSIAHLRTILSKFNEKTKELNADLIGNVRIYTNINQLPPLYGIEMTIDSIIRQMVYPSILVSYMKPDNPEVVGLPTDSGILTIIKMSEEHVSVKFNDSITSATYIGMYDSVQRLFIKWSSDYGSGTVGTTMDVFDGDVHVTTTHEITDLVTLTCRNPEEVPPKANIFVNGTKYGYLLKMNGSVNDAPISENSIIMLTFDKSNESWRYSDTSVSSSMITSAILTDRVADLEKSVDNLINKLDNIEGISAKLNVISSLYVVPDDVPTEIPVENFISGTDLLIVNLMQTILRNDLDYVINDNNTITMTDITLLPKTILQFIVIKQ